MAPAALEARSCSPNSNSLHGQRFEEAVHAHELGSISRSMHDVQPEEVGLTLEEGRVLVQAIECKMIADQIHAYFLHGRRVAAPISDAALAEPDLESYTIRLPV